MVSVISEHIKITPGVCGGKPRIAGHRIKVEDIVIYHERMGLSLNILQLPWRMYTQMTAYYHDHFEEIRQQIQEDEEFAREMQKKTPLLVQQKLKQQNAE